MIRQGGRTKRCNTLAGFLLIILLGACTTVPKPVPDLVPEQLLPSGALLYAHFDSLAMERLLPAIMSAGQDDAARLAAGKNLAPLTKRTDLLVAAIMPPGPAGQGIQPTIYAVAEGKFQTSLINLALGLDKGWKRQGQTWHHAASGITVQAVGGRYLLIGSADISALRQAAETPRLHPVPELWLNEWRSSLSIYMPDPLQRLAASMALPSIEIPLQAIFVTGTGQPDSTYTMKLAFEFDTARSALVFSPICRLLFYGMAHRFWPSKAASILDDTIWRTDGAVISAGNFALYETDLAALLQLSQ